MKMINAVKLLEYNRELRYRYLDKLSELPWEEVVKDRGASFPSLRDIYLHCIVCVDGIVNNILQRKPSFPRINYEEDLSYLDSNVIKKYRFKLILKNKQK